MLTSRSNLKYIFLAALFLIPGSALLEAQVRIGVVIDGVWDRNEGVQELFESEIRELTAGEFDVQFPPEKNLVADWTVAGVDAALDQLLSDPEVDLVLAMGVIASNNVCRRTNLPKPVVAPFVLDAGVQGLPYKDGASGVQNLSYVSLPSTFARDLHAFQEIVPFQNVAILLNPPVMQAVPDILNNIRTVTDSLNMTPTLVPVQNVDEGLAALPSTVEAVYVLPLLHLSASEFDRLVQGLIERKLPSFSLMGRIEVERGLMLSMNPEIFSRVSRRVALNVQQILLGRDAGTLSIVFAAGAQLTVNMATVRAIDVWLPFAALTEADVINPVRSQSQRILDAETAVHRAVEANLDLATKEREVMAGRQNVSLARSNLLPQMDLSATAFQVDKDRADASFGSLPQRKFSGALTLSQVLYSNDAWTNFGAQKDVQLSLEQEQRQLRLDIAQATATAYFQVLRAKTNERVERENLQRTRANLELARVRESVGFSGRADVYRWESEIAANRSRAIGANTQRNIAEIQLNRLLHHAGEAPFETREIDIQDDRILTNQGPVLEYFENQGRFRVFRAFMVQEGLQASPELAQLDALVSARKTLLSGASRAFWAPTVVLQTELENTFSKTQTAGLEIPNVGMLETADDLNWSVALNVSFPLITGGSKKAARSQARQEMEQLKLQRDALAERIEQRIRTALHTAGSSFADIKLSRDAATAAAKNLDLVIDAYSRGALSIIDLIDAQNAALTSEQAAANAVYTFLIDFIEVQRSAGVSGYLMSDGEKMEMYQKLENFAQGEF